VHYGAHGQSVVHFPSSKKPFLYRSKLSGKAQDISGKVVNLVAVQLKIGHPVVGCLKEHPQRQPRYRLHARDREKRWCAGAGPELLRRCHDVTRTAPFFGECPASSDVAKLLRTGSPGSDAEQNDPCQQQGGRAKAASGNTNGNHGCLVPLFAILRRPNRKASISVCYTGQCPALGFRAELPYMDVGTWSPPHNGLLAYPAPTAAMAPSAKCFSCIRAGHIGRKRTKARGRSRKELWLPMGSLSWPPGVNSDPRRGPTMP
jgi:hypothetical protein